MPFRTDVTLRDGLWTANSRQYSCFLVKYSLQNASCCDFFFHPAPDDVRLKREETYRCVWMEKKRSFPPKRSRWERITANMLERMQVYVSCYCEPLKCVCLQEGEEKKKHRWCLNPKVQVFLAVCKLNFYVRVSLIFRSIRFIYPYYTAACKSTSETISTPLSNFLPLY